MDSVSLLNVTLFELKDLINSRLLYMFQQVGMYQLFSVRIEADC